MSLKAWPHTTPCNKKFVIFSDAQYAVDTVIRHMCDDDEITMDHHTANMDIIQRLRTSWNDDFGRIVKVKAHQDPGLLMDTQHKWNTLGNELADCVAKKARDNDMDDVMHMSRVLHKHFLKSVEEFVELFRFLISLSRYRLQCLDSIKPPTHTHAEEIPNVPHESGGGHLFAALDIAKCFSYTVDSPGRRCFPSYFQWCYICQVGMVLGSLYLLATRRCSSQFQ